MFQETSSNIFQINSNGKEPSVRPKHLVLPGKIMLKMIVKLLCRCGGARTQNDVLMKSER